MAATIKADPNPVVFPWPRVLSAGMNKMDTTITWDAGANTRGRVFVSVNGGSETLFDGDPQRGNQQGSKVASIELGQTLEFRLRQVNAANTLMASVMVTTQETPMIPLGVVDPRLSPRAQAIYGLTVRPGVDSVAMSFRTRQPINPFIKILNPDGETVDLFLTANRQQIHEIVFEGWDRPFALNTQHTYHIFADAMPGSWDPRRAEATGSFRTGSRTATFFFDKIHMRLDGDPNSPGEFTFTFGAGDVATEERLGNVESYGESSITDGHTEDVNRTVTVQTAPRLVWAQVVVKEDDSYFDPFDPGGIHAVGMLPSFEPPGSSATETKYYVIAHVTDHFDISEMLNGTSVTPFQMSTGNFVVAFDVLGRLEVEAHSGEWLSASGPMGRLRQTALVTTRDRRVFSIGPGQSAMVTGPEGYAYTVILGPNGEVYHQALGGEPRTSHDGVWTNLGGWFQGPLSVVASGPDRLSLFGLSPDGAVLQKTHAADGRPAHDWRTLGGEFVGPVVTAVGANGTVELFATSENGSVFHRTLTDPRKEQPRGEWTRVGDGTGGSIAALFSPRSCLSLFALGRSGEVLHKRRSPKKEWHPAGRKWEKLGVASDGSLSAEWVGDEVLLLVVVAEDETVRFLAWPDYPDAPPHEGWQVAGTVNSLLQGRIPAGEETPVPDGSGEHRRSSRPEPSNQEGSQMPRDRRR